MKLTTKLVFVVILLYGIFYLSYFGLTPLGQVPVLDGAENFRIAEQIATGTLPREPFFRSILYPALLAIPIYLEILSHEQLMSVASFFGLISHFISAFLVFLCAKSLWKSEKIASLALLIYGLYPLAVFFSTEPLDTTISITFMLAALYFFLQGMDSKIKNHFVTSGVLMGVAGLLRSNLLPFAVVYVFLPLLDKKQLNNALKSIFSLVMVFIMSGLIGFAYSGEFRLLPWQGASNFYSANSKNANGKYYKHSVYLTSREAGVNPARQEAEYIYSQETQKSKPFKIDEFNWFWIKKTLSEITSEPRYWLELMGKKVYYLFNNYEQYNNKTFGFHKEITPILRGNPLCYGLVLVLFFVSISNLKDVKDKSKLRLIIASITTLSLGIIGFYVSARFRLPIVSLLVIVGVGVFRYTLSEIMNFKNALILAIIAFLTFSSYFEATDKSTWNEDRLLNAFACSRLFYDEEQMLWANLVLKDEPNNLQAIRLKSVGFFNMVLDGKIVEEKDWNQIDKEMAFISKKGLYFDDTVLLGACYAWKKEKNKRKAVNLWLQGGSESPQPELFRACMIYVGESDYTSTDLEMAKQSPILAAALAHQGVEIPYSETYLKALAFLLA